MLHPGQFYHLYNHANGSENLFCEEKNYYFTAVVGRLINNKITSMIMIRFDHYPQFITITNHNWLPLLKSDYHKDIIIEALKKE